MEIIEITGKFVLKNGEEIEFRIDEEYSQQWGNTNNNLSKTVELLEKLTNAMHTQEY